MHRSPTQAEPKAAQEPPRRSPETADRMTDQWIRETHPALYRTAWAMTGDCAAAEDLAQETLVIAFRNWHAFDGRSSREAWTQGILVRLVRKHFRSLARWRRRLDQYISLVGSRTSNRGTSTDAAAALAMDEWRQSVWARVSQLPRPQAEAITLRFAKQLSYDEIGILLGCPPGTAKSRVHHGLIRMRQVSESDLLLPTADRMELRFQ